MKARSYRANKQRVRGRIGRNMWRRPINLSQIMMLKLSTKCTNYSTTSTNNQRRHHAGVCELNLYRYRGGPLPLVQNALKLTQFISMLNMLLRHTFRPYSEWGLHPTSLPRFTPPRLWNSWLRLKQREDVWPQSLTRYAVMHTILRCLSNVSLWRILRLSFMCPHDRCGGCKINYVACLLLVIEIEK